MKRIRGPGPPGGGIATPASRRRPSQTSAWRRSSAAIVRNASRAMGILLHAREAVVQVDGVALHPERGRGLPQGGGIERQGGVMPGS